MKQSSVNLDITNNADGFDISGGTTKRKLTITGADIEMAGSGDDTYTFPSGGGTLATMEAVYPVGSIYISVSSTNPATLFGGTWVAFGEGKVLVGLDAGDTDFDTAEEKGGEKTHTLITAEMPAHNHPMKFGATPGGDGTGYTYSGTTGTGTSPFNPANVGGGGAHNNLQPYITVYMFKRTS